GRGAGAADHGAHHARHGEAGRGRLLGPGQVACRSRTPAPRKSDATENRVSHSWRQGQERPQALPPGLTMPETRDYCLPAELVEAARRVIEAHRQARLRVAVAESCTGGLVSAALTEIPGSSDVFEAGLVTYANEAKTELLKVSDEVLETFGAVSVAVAWAMAQGVLT